MPREIQVSEGSQRRNQRSQSEQADGETFWSNIFRTHASTSESQRISDLATLESSSSRRAAVSRSIGGSEASALRNFANVESSGPVVASLNTSNDGWKTVKSREIAQTSADQIQGETKDPPRPAREGYEWVWFPQGYWAEREKLEIIFATPKSYGWTRKHRICHHKHGSQHSSSEGTGRFPRLETPLPLVSPPVWSQPKGGVSSVEDAQPDELDNMLHDPSHTQRFVKTLNLLSPTYPHFISPSGEPEGLYCKTKRGFEHLSKKHKELAEDVSPTSPPSKALASRTTMILEGSSSYFDPIPPDQKDQQVGLHAQDSPSLEPRTTRKRFGLAPWHRQGSYDTLWTVSSSVRNLLLGKTPVSTPSVESPMQEDLDNHVRKQGIIPSKNSEFLSGEARRIDTPPMSKTLVAGHTRGFFFDFTPRNDDIENSQDRRYRGKVVSKEPRGASEPIRDNGKGVRQWWEVDIPVSAERGELQPANFTLDIPEHLPSSPLCPMNPKHKSGGTGICVYHGRRVNRASSSDTSEHPRGKILTHLL